MSTSGSLVRPNTMLIAAPPTFRVASQSVTDRETLRWRDWPFAAVVSAITVGLCFFATFWLPGLLDDHAWLGLGDAPATVQSAQYVANGGLPWVYSVNPDFLPLPGFLLLLAPAVAIGEHHHLLNATPYPLAHPSMWLVVTPIFFLAGATSVLGVDYLADTLNVSRCRRRILAAALSVLVVVPTCCWVGHPEDLLCLALSCLAIALMIRRRHSGAALSLAAAILIQPWAGLLVPLLLVVTPVGQRLRSLLYSCAAPALMAVILLAMDFKDAYRSLVIQPMPDSHGQQLPWWSLTHATRIVTDSGPMLVRVGSLPRTVAVLIAVAAALSIRRRSDPRHVMAVASVALVARGLFETQLWCYYLAPGAVFMALGAAAFAKSRQVSWPIGAGAALVFYGAVAGAYDRVGFSPTLAMAVLILSAGAGTWAALGGPSASSGLPVPGFVLAWRKKRTFSA